MATKSAWRTIIDSPKGPPIPPLPRREIVKLLRRLKKTIDKLIVVIERKRPRRSSRRRR
jgi:hypothetical protein